MFEYTAKIKFTDHLFTRRISTAYMMLRANSMVEARHAIRKEFPHVISADVCRDYGYELFANAIEEHLEATA